MSASLWLKRISAVLIGLVAVVAIVLAGTGIYSVVFVFGQPANERGRDSRGPGSGPA
jgi:hypothetical protein